MAGDLSARSRFDEVFAIHLALKSAIQTRLLDRHAKARAAAEAMRRHLESERSVYGKQLKMIALMEKGASLADLSRRLRCSRRTVFRYLNNLQEGGVTLNLENGTYRVDREVVRLLRR
ncbi:MAG: helix-turn-helix domain-containing protein [Planctomycetes bacterium]|nr:helix-turn-helix domain-containing protein [Planctomycetota bacterium]